MSEPRLIHTTILADPQPTQLGFSVGTVAWRPIEGFRLEGGVATFCGWDGGHPRRLPGHIDLPGITGTNPPAMRPLLMFDLVDLEEASDAELVDFASEIGAFHDVICPAPIGLWRTGLQLHAQAMAQWNWENREGPIPKEENDFLANITPITLPFPTEVHLLPSNKTASITASGLFNIAAVQMAIAITSKESFPLCTVCGTRFKYVPEGGRVNQEFCSVNCKMRAFRAKKKRARELHAAGMTPAKIAKELGSSTDVVKGWLKKK